MNNAAYDDDNFLTSLLVVLVLYERNLEESEAFTSLSLALSESTQSVSLFVYDNSALPHEIPIQKTWNIHYRHDGKNAGVSRAYNAGFEWARSQNKKWLLLVDQDTYFPKIIFNHYYQATRDSATSLIVPRLVDSNGIISPHKFKWGGGQRKKKIPSDSLLSLSDYYFLNSGMLVSVSTFGAARYDELLTLDFSDFAFIERLRPTVSHFRVTDLDCIHRLSSGELIPLSLRLNRFKNYLWASRYFKMHYRPNAHGIGFRNLLRTLKLSLQYRSITFIAGYLRAL
jgi:GT2 family glycosyltransferase